MTQLVTRIDEALAAALDELIAAGVVENRSQAVRMGLEALVDRHRRDDAGRQIVEGYRLVPQTDAEVNWADGETARMIAEEPW